jgi:hypothetical protein
MRPNLIFAVGAFALAIVVIWRLTTIVIAPHPQNANAAAVSPSIDTMQMMKNARNLPIERFDAH